MSWLGLCVQPSERHSEWHPGVSRGHSSLEAGLRCPRVWRGDMGGCCPGDRQGGLCVKHAHSPAKGQSKQGQQREWSPCTRLPGDWFPSMRENVSNYLQLQYKHTEDKIELVSLYMQQRQIASHNRRAGGRFVSCCWSIVTLWLRVKADLLTWTRVFVWCPESHPIWTSA